MSGRRETKKHSKGDFAQDLNGFRVRKVEVRKEKCAIQKPDAAREAQSKVVYFKVIDARSTMMIRDYGFSGCVH